ncbi:hypothetical protein Bca4012_088913 [Brassica carinata]
MPQPLLNFILQLLRRFGEPQPNLIETSSPATPTALVPSILPLQVLCLSLFPHLSYATSGDHLCPFKTSIAPIYSTCMKNLAFKAKY